MNKRFRIHPLPPHFPHICQAEGINPVAVLAIHMNCCHLTEWRKQNKRSYSTMQYHYIVIWTNLHENVEHAVHVGYYSW